MKRILVPVDGSDTSMRAVQLALEMAQAQTQRPELCLLNVQAPILSGNVTRFLSAEEIEQFYQDESAKALESAKTLLDGAQYPYRADAKVGLIAPTIDDYISEHACDHVVMGTRGLGAVSRVVLGSVSTRVLATVKVPVTLVP